MSVAICVMANKVFVLGTFDQPVAALFDVDLMRYLSDVGIDLAGVIYKNSQRDRNPAHPVGSQQPDNGKVCLHVRNFSDREVVACVNDLRPDLLIYAGGRDILRQPLLEAARLGCIGGHYGYLPAVRGMATVEWSVLLGIPLTVAIQRISPGIDTGDILMQASVPLVPGDTYASIRDRSYFLTKTMLALSANALLNNDWHGTAQVPEDGKQYYRIHSRLQEKAQHALGALLSLRRRPASADFLRKGQGDLQKGGL